MKAYIPQKKLSESVLGIKIERMNDGYVESKMQDIAIAHRNDFCICILPNKGHGAYFVDFTEVSIDSGSLLFLYPGQICRVLGTNNIEGWILYFDARLIDNTTGAVLEESLYHGPVLSLSSDHKQWLMALMQLLHSTSDLRDMSNYHMPEMQALVKSFIYRLTALYQSSATQDMKHHSQRSTGIVTEFRKVLRANFRTVKSPQEYANFMNLSLGYLNDTLKSVTGNTVSYSIQEEAIKEAQRLLWHSEMNIKEIASAVGFDDPKYFSRVFSKVTGSSPASFKKTYQFGISTKII